MTNTGTTPCVNCGHFISKNAQKCPKCSGECVSCLLCKQPIKTKEVYRPHGRNDGYAFHKNCLGFHFLIPPSVACPDCGVELSSTKLQGSLLKATDISCPDCGSPDPLGGRRVTCSCYACGCPVFTAFQTARKSYNHSSYYENCPSGPVTNYHPFHDFCLASYPGATPMPD